MGHGYKAIVGPCAGAPRPVKLVTAACTSKSHVGTPASFLGQISGYVGQMRHESELGPEGVKERIMEGRKERRKERRKEGGEKGR